MATGHIRQQSQQPMQNVLQGSVFGALLYINDLPRNITSTIRLYADDAIIYRIIHSADDIQKLQEDLNILHQWAKGLCYLIH